MVYLLKSGYLSFLDSISLSNLEPFALTKVIQHQINYSCIHPHFSLYYDYTNLSILHNRYLFAAFTNTLLYEASLITDILCGFAYGSTLKLISPHYSKKLCTLIIEQTSPARCLLHAINNMLK